MQSFISAAVTAPGQAHSSLPTYTLSSLYIKLWRSPCQCGVHIGLYTLSSRWGLCMGCRIMKGVTERCIARLRLTLHTKIPRLSECIDHIKEAKSYFYCNM